MFLSLLLTLGPTYTVETDPTLIQYRIERTAPRGEMLMRQTMIETHNATRAQVAQQPLEWDEGLAQDAAKYARELAARDMFKHAPQAKYNPQGENLWRGSRGAFSIQEMAYNWINEKRNFINGPIPHISRTGNFFDVGHYTQIIWPTTTHMGCAMASNAKDDYLVCRYYPAGNVWGEKAMPQRRTRS